METYFLISNEEYEKKRPIKRSKSKMLKRKNTVESEKKSSQPAPSPSADASEPAESDTLTTDGKEDPPKEGNLNPPEKPADLVNQGSSSSISREFVRIHCFSSRFHVSSR